MSRPTIVTTSEKATPESITRPRFSVHHPSFLWTLCHEFVRSTTRRKPALNGTGSHFSPNDGGSAPALHLEACHIDGKSWLGAMLFLPAFRIAALLGVHSFGSLGRAPPVNECGNAYRLLTGQIPKLGEIGSSSPILASVRGRLSCFGYPVLLSCKRVRGYVYPQPVARSCPHHLLPRHLIRKLVEVAVGPQTVGATYVFGMNRRTYDHHGDEHRLLRGAHLAQHAEAVYTRHAEVQEHQTRHLCSGSLGVKQIFDCLYAVVGEQHFVCNPLSLQQDRPGQLCEICVVIHQQNDSVCHEHSLLVAYIDLQRRRNASNGRVSATLREQLIGTVESSTYRK